MNDYMIRLFPLLIIFIIANTFHNYVKAWIAYRYMHDTQAKVSGRLNLNPFMHLDIIGTITLFFFYLGWPKPMPVSFNEMGKKKWAILVVELSGCLANLALALAGIVIYLIFKWLEPITNLDFRTIKLALEFFSAFNVFYALFNLLPLPQLPGFRILVGLFYHKPQGVLESWYLTYTGWLILVILIIWTPLVQWISGISSTLLQPMGLIGKPYFAYFDLIKFIGGF